MIIIGVDYHPSDQHIAFAATETGERGERRLNHSDGEVEKFYRDLAQRRDAQVASGSFSSWVRPGSLHSFFFLRCPSFIASACN
jgi:hypothetical protein